MRASHNPVHLKIHHTDILLKPGDITRCEADAIVNPANSQLILGGGVAGAIRQAGGPAIQKECDGLAPCPVGDAVATTAGRLKARYVIHAVGPRWGEGDEVAKLEKAVTASLKRADELGLKSLAMPAISTGIFGFPLEQAANTILAVIVRYAVGPTGLRTVFLSLFDEKSVKVFSEVMDSLRPE